MTTTTQLTTTALTLTLLHLITPLPPTIWATYALLATLRLTLTADHLRPTRRHTPHHQAH